MIGKPGGLGFIGLCCWTSHLTNLSVSVASFKHRGNVPASQSLVFKEDFHGKAPGCRPGTEWVCNAASFFPPKYIHMSPHPSDSVLRYIAAWWRQYYQCLLLGESLIYLKMLIECCGLYNNGSQRCPRCNHQNL